jgi:hypothetical protein
MTDRYEEIYRSLLEAGAGSDEGGRRPRALDPMASGLAASGRAS